MRALLLDAANLNTLREALYGRQARLSFYKMSPSLGETLIMTISTGWHAAREKRDRLDGRNNRVLIWVAREAITGDLKSQLDIGSKVDISFDAGIQTYRIIEIRTMSQLHSGWVINCEPVESATGF